MDNVIQENAGNKYSKQVRGREFTNSEIEIYIHGRNNKHTLEYLLNRELDSTEINRLAEEKETIYRKLCLFECPNFKLSPGAIELFEYLKLKNVKFALATDTEKNNLNFFNKNLALSKWFEMDKIVYDDGAHQGKPDPEVYLVAAKMIELNPNECIVVEDSVSGIISANKAGIGYIIVISSLSTQEKFQKVEGVKKVIQNLNQFPRDLLI